MRRISLALALVGAVAATGCGNTSTSNGGGGNRGVVSTFNVTVQNGQDGNTSLAITGGYVTSSPAGIDCGAAPHSGCSFDFPAGTVVTLTATALTGYNFWAYAGDCYTANTACGIVNTKADQTNYVLARFGAIGEQPPGGHPDWNPHAGGVSHAAEAEAFLATVPGMAFQPSPAPWQCTQCHGSMVLGMGLAPNCADCHIGSAYKTWGGVAANPPAKLANGEVCTGCHPSQGANHQALFTKWNKGMPNAADNALRGGTIQATVDSVATSAAGSKYDVKVTFSVKKNGAPLGGIDFNTAWGTKTLYVTKYDRATSTFPATLSVGFGSIKETSTAGTYVATKAGQTTDWAASDGFAYLYLVGTTPVFYPEGHYTQNSEMADAGLKFNAGTPVNGITTGAAANWTYTSVAQSSGCERCHGAPYAKHGYRRAKAFGLADDFLACKACHWDNRPGTDFNFQVMRNDPAGFVALGPIEDATWASGAGLAYATKYAYTANIMNDTHMSHAMEFEFPQRMSNCTVCHGTNMSSGPGGVFEDVNFRTDVCKSCHATDLNLASKYWGAGMNGEERAPLLIGGTGTGYTMPSFHNNATGTKINWDMGGGYTRSSDPKLVQCYYCHNAGSGDPTLASLHNGGFEPIIYVPSTGTALDGTRYDAAFQSAVTAASLSGNTLSFTATVTGAVDFSAATTFGQSSLSTAMVNPQFYVAPFGYDTKDFLGSKNCNTTSSSCSGWTKSSSTSGTWPNQTTTWTMTVDVSSYAGQISTGVIKRFAIGFKPILKDGNGVTLAQIAPLASFTIGSAGVTPVADTIADAAKCNKCHDALGSTFHDGSRGGSVAFCRVCHVPGSGAGYLEMQSRSIDSFIHGIHENQFPSIGSKDFIDPVSAQGYEDYIGGAFPNFAITANCEACHTAAGTYEAKDESASLPAILSASAPNSATKGLFRSVSVPSVITGPAAKACGSCHRAYMIKNQMFTELSAFDDHTKAFGFRETPANATVMGTVLRNIYGTY